MTGPYRAKPQPAVATPGPVGLVVLHKSARACGTEGCSETWKRVRTRAAAANLPFSRGFSATQMGVNTRFGTCVEQRSLSARAVGLGPSGRKAPQRSARLGFHSDQYRFNGPLFVRGWLRRDSLRCSVRSVQRYSLRACLGSVQSNSL